MSRRWLTWAVDALLVVAVLGVIMYVARQHVPAGTLRLSRSDWRALTTDGVEIGSRNGKVVVVEFVDYQCPVCARMEPLMAKLDHQFPNMIRRVVRHLPLESIHPQAMLSAKALECAREQGATQKMHDLLFATQAIMKSIAFDTLGSTVGVSNALAFSNCMQGETHPRIWRDMELASALGVAGAPTVIVDGLLLTSLSSPILLSLIKSRLD
jgi:protein-disulfide isomerase